MRRAVLFYMFANLFRVWQGGIQLNSHTCFCTQSVVSNMPCSLWETTTLSYEITRKKGQKCLGAVMNDFVTLQGATTVKSSKTSDPLLRDGHT